VATEPADEAWKVLSSHLSPTHHPFVVHELLYHANYAAWREAEHGPPPCTLPDPAAAGNTAAADFMRSWDSPAWRREGGGGDEMADDFRALHAASVEDPASFWAHVARRSGVPQTVLGGGGGEFLRFDPSAPGGSERWLPDAKLNIAKTCFEGGAGKEPGSTALVWSREGESTEGGGGMKVHTMTRGELRARADAVAAALVAAGLSGGGGNSAARVAVVLPLTAECVPLYLGVVLAGAAAVCIADSFAPEEIAARLTIGAAAAVVTQDDVIRDERRLPLYPRVAAAADRAAAAAGGRGVVIPAVVMACAAESCASVYGDDDGEPPSGGAGAPLSGPLLRRCDVTYAAFLRRGYSLLRSSGPFRAVQMPASSPTAILFSSGTTGTPKAIPWDHVAPLHGISDGNLHMDVKAGDVAVWPTNLGWMMGSWWGPCTS
jgi:hypothetical protein